MMGVVDSLDRYTKAKNYLNRNVSDFYIVDGGIVPSSLGLIPH
jgi:hypothetical protein